MKHVLLLSGIISVICGVVLLFVLVTTAMNFTNIVESQMETVKNLESKNLIYGSNFAMSFLLIAIGALLVSKGLKR